MATLLAGEMLADISAASPCGDDLEYDPDFLALEQVVHGKPEVQFGETMVAATPPDWKVAEALSLDLLAKGRDLRVAVHLARALLNRRRFPGFAEGLALVEGLLEQRWDHVYPQLDPDDDNDPTARVNALAALVEPSGMLVDVRDAPLASSRAHGGVSLRDIEYATGEVPLPKGVEAASLSSIDAVIADAHQDAAEAHTALLAATHSAMRIETVLTERVGAARSIDLSPLSRLLRRAADFLGERLDVPGGAPQASPNGDVTPGESAGAAPAPVPLSGDITDRQDVIRMIDKICAYYERHEPSSPLPLLLRRARRLVDRNFMEILQDLAPEGVRQARQAGGIENE
ncbi:type VI secretion system protein ImpA [Paraburkholderia sp. HC6.4b]|uniref:type VI secretion system protein TssA n=1 Tax=unclassified Paraburkholderia TaxID=2615204 RepID=UPI001610CF40|nr:MULTISPECIES: type VI secretion system protein TssA [unclassified Paraburkholderia]MBB5412717.1 type VI secretion system protein ImpA [Paraburkholderia sp. HC6.4b]MBB5454679.1 type VI secretion system protein ImpA [Paraburkholderia sp. Kb1A]